MNGMVLRLKVYRLLLKVAVYALSIPAFYLGWWLWNQMCLLTGRPALFSPEGNMHFWLVGAVIWAFASERAKVTSFDELFRERTGARAAFSACVTSTCVLLAVLYFTRNEIFPRGLLVWSVITIFVLTILLHAFARIVLRSQASMARPSRLLVVGADEFAREAAKRLQRLSFAPCTILGFVRLPLQKPRVNGQRVFEMDQLAELDTSSGIDEAVIAIPAAQFSQIPEILKHLEHLCLPTRAVVDFGEGVVVRDKLFQLGNLQMLDLTATPAESLDYALIKRAFDACFSALILLLCAPIFGAVWLIIRLTSPGPVFFVQERIGLNGRPFRMYKFRTMRVTTQSEGDTRWTTHEDPRRTAFGSFLRKTSLDELPQFINVLKGDMSVVGPRPERPFFVHKFLEEYTRYNHRHSLKVGITGWAQVNGWRGDTSIEKRVEYDLYYLQNWSLGFDLRIILMTLFAGLVNRNAY